MVTWWGTFPEAGLGTPTGVGEGLWCLDGSGAAQVLEVPAPSFVIAHPTLPLLYASSETEESRVHAIDVSNPANPRIVASQSTGGASACHLLLSRDARTLYVSHFMSGNLAVVTVEEDGLFAQDAPAQQWSHEGSGPRDMQEAPRAHFAAYAPGDTHLLVCDLGTDQLRAYRVGADGLLEDAGIAATFPAGAGPRHLVVRGPLLYVACQLDHTLRTLRWDAASATAEIIAEQPVTAVAPRSDHILHAAHVDIVEDALLVSVRGADVIAVFDLAPEGEAHYRGAFDSGEWPRYFMAIEDRLYVAAERQHQARSYALADVLGLAPEMETGAVAQLEYQAAAVPSPACVAAR